MHSQTVGGRLPGLVSLNLMAVREEATARSAVSFNTQTNTSSLDEVDDDELTETDVRQALLHGKW